MFPFLEEPTWYGMLLLVIAVLLLTVELKFYTHMISGITGAILLAFGIILLFPAPDRISPAFATAVSVAIGIIIVCFWEHSGCAPGKRNCSWASKRWWDKRVSRARRWIQQAP
jgi:membrane-bound ClpP family serine protease